MANLKTYDLLQCSRLYPTVNGANNAAFSPFIDDVVKINDDEQQSYTVKENVQARFLAPRRADGVSNVQYSVTSIVFNGSECLTANANLTVEEDDNYYIEFPLYSGSPTGYDNNVATAVITEQSLVPTIHFEKNFIDFMQGLFDSLNVSVDIVNSHPDWWSLEAFPSMENFMIEMYSSDTLSFSVRETYNGVSRKLTYTVDGTGAIAYIGGIDVTLIPVPANEQPQFGDVYSINSYPVTASPIVEIDCCPFIDPFYASLSNDNCCSSLKIDCDCSKITFSDTSNYDNGLVGHDPSFFNHRVITLTRPDGSQYLWSTDGEIGQPYSACGCSSNVSSTTVVDQLIEPHWNSSNMFAYNFTNNDQDGLYSVNICTYPDWQSDVFYDIVLKNFVYRNGVVYKQTASNTNVDPELDTDNEYWVVATAEEDKGRYCSEERVLVLCISILECYKKLVQKALCDIEANPCKNMCENPSLMNSAKMRITLDALDWAVCDKNWDLAEKHISILKSICCCNG